MRTLAAFFVLILLAGCASSPNAGQGDDQRNVITREQAIETGASTVYQVVRRLHPRWLPNRPGSFIVIGVVDGSRGGRPRLARRIDAGDQIETDQWDEFTKERGWEGVFEIRWMETAEAFQLGQGFNTTFGPDLAGGILIRTIPR